MRTRLVPAAILVAAVLGGAYVYAQDHAGSGAPKPDLAAKILGVNPNNQVHFNDEQMDLARSIGRDVVCLCGGCPKEPMSDCDCPWAGTNRRIIQNAMAKGMTREQIIAGYRQAYGEKILAMIPEDGFAQMAWIVPYAGVVVMLFAFFAIGFRFLRKRDSDAQAAANATPGEGARAAGPADARKELDRELEELD